MTNIAIMLLITFAMIRADTLELKTGERIEGVFKQAGPAGAVIEVGGQPITFTMDKVRAIYLGAGPAVQPGPSPAAGAIDALRSLRSVTTSGINYLDYSSRVLDAKAVVDKYRDSVTNDPARDAILAAMNYYDMGLQAWRAKILPRSVDSEAQRLELGGRILADSCPHIVALVKSTDSYAKTYRSAERRQSYIGAVSGEAVMEFWKCGNEKVAEAETAK